MFLKRLLDEKWKEKTFYKFAVFISIGVILAAAVINVYLFVHNLAVIDTVKEFWFPD
jgi:ADP-glucose pyrophosphorylase